MRTEDAYIFCPICGGRFEKKRQTTLRCTSCGFHFFINPKACVTVALINEKDEMLLVTRKYDPYKDMLDTPGGFVDVHESAEQALVREIKEEIGYTLDTYTYVGSYPEEYEYEGKIVDVLSNCYVASIPSDAVLQANDDVSDYRWVPIKEISMDQIGFPSMQSFLTDLLASKG